MWFCNLCLVAYGRNEMADTMEILSGLEGANSRPLIVLVVNET